MRSYRRRSRSVVLIVPQLIVTKIAIENEQSRLSEATERLAQTPVALRRKPPTLLHVYIVRNDSV